MDLHLTDINYMWEEGQNFVKTAQSSSEA